MPRDIYRSMTRKLFHENADNSKRTVMRTRQNHWTPSTGWRDAFDSSPSQAQWVLLFGSTDILQKRPLLEDIKAHYPKALIMGCSTAGEIAGANVWDDSLTLTEVIFDQTTVEKAEASVSHPDQSRAAGEELAKKLINPWLKHVFVLSDGLHVNGTELVQGLRSQLPAGVQVTGGLAGDGARFQQTIVVSSDQPDEKRVVAVGFYSDILRVGYGSLGGWDPFGPDRLITKSRGNVLYELDGKSALDLYKNYLGEHASGLPATGLLFPLCLTIPDNPQSLVRTILSVNEQEKSMTFAGDMPEGSYARLMKANFDRLIDGAQSAARTSTLSLKNEASQLAVLISCVGRKLILKQRVEEEVEAVRDVLGAGVPITGFYSYGEIAPFQENARCELHNQTMTITVFSEAA